MLMAPEVVQDVLGGDGLGADARLGEGQVLGDLRVEVVADHEHVEVLVDGVHGEGQRGVGGRGQARWARRHADDVRARGRRPRLPCGRCGSCGPAMARDRVLDEAGLVERVGVDRHLDVELVGDLRGSAVDGRGRGAPVLVQLEPDGARRAICSRSGSGCEALPLPRNPRLTGQASAASQHPLRCSTRPGVQVVALVPVAGPVPPPIMRGDARARCASSTSCGQMKWMWLSMPPAVTMRPSPGDDLGAGADHHARDRRRP